ncbi:MAG: YjbH domain-containing protein, partial [Endozoicomonadaceae bacterium]|nr:YjbH domain-containing protein [Endozoicomonadaceae bacterium]
MNMDVKKIILIFVIFNVVVCQANENEITSELNIEIKKSHSLQAFTGGFNTPNAEVISYGDFSFAYSNNYYDQGYASIKFDGFQKATDLKFGLGLFPNLEIIGRLGTATIQCNHYFEKNCGFRDLSGSIKYQIPFVPKNWFQLAIGGQDVGGSIVTSQAYYISVSKSFSLHQFGAVRTSFGISSSNNALDYMNGAFGSVEYQPFDFLQVAAEYDANAVNAGVKLFAPEAWLPKGWQVSAAAQLYTSDSDNNERDEWFSFNLTIPMGSTSPRKTTKQVMNDVAVTSSRTLHREALTANIDLSDGNSAIERVVIDKSSKKSTSDSQTVSDVSTITQDDLNAFARFLADYGFESINIGLDKQLDNRVVIQFENNLYNQNEDDAMRVMAKLVDQHLHTNVTINLTNFGLVVKTVNLNFDNSIVLSSEQFDSADDTNLVSGLFTNNDINWLVKNESSSYLVPRLIVAPALASLVGTEYGAFDFQLLLSINAQMSLWPGAIVDFRYLSDTIA